MQILATLPKDLLEAKTRLYDPCGFVFTHPVLLAEGKEYGACRFQLNGKTVQHRVAKITPTKTGQFVTLWKRNEEGITAPYDQSDDLDLAIITVRKEGLLGQFVFPKVVLIQQTILTHNGKEGKRGFRVYPSWDQVANKQAEQTQRWQLRYFILIEEESKSLPKDVQRLFANL